MRASTSAQNTQRQGVSLGVCVSLCLSVCLSVCLSLCWQVCSLTLYSLLEPAAAASLDASAIIISKVYRCITVRSAAHSVVGLRHAGVATCLRTGHKQGRQQNSAPLCMRTTCLHRALAAAASCHPLTYTYCIGYVDVACNARFTYSTQPSALKHSATCSPCRPA